MPPARFFLFLASALSGCSSLDKLLEGNVPSDARLVTRLDPGTLRVEQGGEATLTATVIRIGAHSGQVTLSVEDLPPGVTGEIEGRITRDSVTTATLRLRAGVAAPLGGHVVKVRGHLDGLADNIALLVLEVTPVLDFSLSLSQPALTVVHGGRALLTVRLLRSNFTGPVLLLLVGPEGISGTFATNPATGAASALTLTVALSLAPGSYSLKVRGVATGLPDQEASLALTVTADPVQLLMSPDHHSAQGALTGIDIIVNRSTYSGAVTLSVENLPPGVSGSLQPSAPLGDSAVLLLTIGPHLLPGNYPVTVRGAGNGVPVASTTFQLVISASSIDLALGPGNLSLLPGTGGTVRLLLNRTAFSGPVAVTVDGAPPGLTVLPDATGLDGTTASLAVTAAGFLASGQYPLTVRAVPVLPGATAPQSVRSGADPVSLAEVSATLLVTVHPLPAGNGNVSLDWSGCPPPAWVAYQDGGGPWIQSPSASALFRFTVNADRGGYAYIHGDSLVVRYATQAELTAEPVVICRPALPVRTVTAFASHFIIPPNLIDPPFLWHLGGGNGTSSPGEPFFSIFGVLPGVHDLIGWGTPVNVGPRMLLRRDLDPPDRSDLGVLNLRGTEAFPAAQSILSITGGGGDLVSHGMSYLTTAGCDVARLYTTSPSQSDPHTATMRGAPPEVQRLEDYHLLGIVATAPDGSARRTLNVVFHAMWDQTMALPPHLPHPAVTSLPGTFKRLEGRLENVPVDFEGLLTLSYGDASQAARVSATIGYAGVSGVVLAMPDLSGVSGWPAATALPAEATGNWSFSAESSPPLRLCAEGRRVLSAARFGTF
jgi:hypothetical protein